MKKFLITAITLVILFTSLSSNEVIADKLDDDAINYSQYIHEKKLRIDFKDNFKELKDYYEANDIEYATIIVYDENSKVIFNDNVKLKNQLKIDVEIELEEEVETINYLVVIVTEDKMFYGYYNKIFVREDTSNYIKDKMEAKQKEKIVILDVIDISADGISIEELDEEYNRLLSSENETTQSLSMMSAPAPTTTTSSVSDSTDDFEGECVLVFFPLPGWICTGRWDIDNYDKYFAVADLQSVEGVHNTFDMGLDKTETNTLELEIGAFYEGVGFSVTSTTIETISQSQGFSHTVMNGESYIIGTKFAVEERDTGSIYTNLTKTIIYGVTTIRREVVPESFIGGVSRMEESQGSNYSQE